MCYIATPVSIWHDHGTLTFKYIWDGYMIFIRFLIDITSDAKGANRSGLFGSIKSASQMAHWKCMTDSDCYMSRDSTIEVGGTTIRMDDGYPSENHFLSSNIAGLVDYGDWQSMLTSNKVIWWYPGTTLAESDCTIEYRWSGGSGESTFS
jgi:hypothetical protein